MRNVVVRRTVVAVLVVLAILIVATCMTREINMQMGGEIEHKNAEEIVRAIQKSDVLAMSDQAYFETARNLVTINLYGITETKKQDSVVDLIRQRGVSVPTRVCFYPQRTYVESVEGRAVTRTLVKKAALRTIDIGN